MIDAAKKNQQEKSAMVTFNELSSTLQTTPHLLERFLFILTQLLNKKEEVYAEIGAYPPPIPACDVQFNHLLAQRSETDQAIRQLKRIAATEMNEAEYADRLADFLTTHAQLVEGINPQPNVNGAATLDSK